MRARKTKASLIATLAVGALTWGSAASADPTVSQLQANPAAVTVASGSTQSVALNLDPDTCAQALENGANGLAYTVGGESANSALATVSVAKTAGDGGCNSIFTGTVRGVCPGATSILFTPLVYNPGGTTPKGVQKRVAPVSVPVTVTGLPCDSTGGDETGDDARPAAPAVANLYINGSGITNKAWQVSACMSHFKGDKFWRGSLIKQVAAWMPRPESVKDNTAIFETSGDWVAFVVGEVDSLCAGTGDVSFSTVSGLTEAVNNAG